MSFKLNQIKSHHNHGTYACVVLVIHLNLAANLIVGLYLNLIIFPDDDDSR